MMISFALIPISKESIMFEGQRNLRFWNVWLKENEPNAMICKPKWLLPNI